MPGMMRAMHIELLVVPDCPNEVPARDLVTAVLAEHGLTASLVTTVLSTDEEAQARGFTGSPTFLVDGADPFAHGDGGVGLACRVYPTAHGPSGVPDRNDLARALTISRNLTR